jgi:hypothetical protein
VVGIAAYEIIALGKVRGERADCGDEVRGERSDCRGKVRVRGQIAEVEHPLIAANGSL